jgi:hypothetical protein
MNQSQNKRNPSQTSESADIIKGCSDLVHLVIELARKSHEDSSEVKSVNLTIQSTKKDSSV